MEVFADTQEDTMREAARFFKTCRPVEGHATLVTLFGDLGAGKTTYVKGVALSGGVTRTVTSPTFVFMKEYPLSEKENLFKKLVHIDAYRMETPQMLRTVIPEDIFTDARNIIFLEWPQCAEGFLPSAEHTILIEALPDIRRHIIYDNIS